MFKGLVEKIGRPIMLQELVKKQKGGQQLSMLCQLYTQFVDISLPHQAGIELSDFHARGWKSDQGGRNSMQEMHGNQTKCMEFQPIKENSNF